MPQEKLKTMLMQNFGGTNKEHYGMLWYFLEWSISGCSWAPKLVRKCEIKNIGYPVVWTVIWVVSVRSRDNQIFYNVLWD